MDLSSDLDERRVALLRAKEHNLDVIRVAQVTAERSVERAFEVRPLFFPPIYMILPVV